MIRLLTIEYRTGDATRHSLSPPVFRWKAPTPPASIGFRSGG